MSRYVAFAVGVAFLVRPVAAEDPIAPETVTTVKKATVFVRVEGTGWASTGSGFVVAADDKAVLVATNHHVASPSSAPTPRPGEKPPTITVVFDSGTRTERSFTAEIAASDPERDLAVLRVVGVKDAPRPIAYTPEPKLVETMTVYTFGFPFGKALSTTKGFPAITVGKASVSSLRQGADGELAVVQIDGNLNPGNSGGPVVDAKGQLAGVAVATIRDGQGIGLTIPSAELAKVMAGRIGRVRVIPRQAENGPATVRVEVDLIDPMQKLRGVTARYFVVPPQTKRPEPTALDKHPESKKLDLRVEKGVASAEFTVEKAEGEILVQVVADASAGKSVASRVRAFTLMPFTIATLTAPPPAGWKVYTARSRAFIMWVPEKPQKQSDEERSTVVGGQRIRASTLVGKSADGLVYQADSITLPFNFAKMSRMELFELVRDAVAELNGRVIDAKEVRMGNTPGTEYLIESGTRVTRMRMFTSGVRIAFVLVSGTDEQVNGPEGEMILSAFRLPGIGNMKREPGDIAPKPKDAVGGKEPVVIGGRLDSVSKDVGPEGGLLVGLEVVIGKPISDELIQSVRPIYRVNGKESFGAQFGTDVKGAITIKAKDGYAIGKLSGKARNVLDGFSVTFMKVKDGKLDPMDSYESEWIGWNGPRVVTQVGGDGTPVVGVAVKIGNVPGRTVKDVTGVGLIFKEGAIAKKPENAAPAAAAAAFIPVPVGKNGPAIIGGGRDPQFKELAPEGGLLVGFEIGITKTTTGDMTRAIRPIFRSGDNVSFGEQRGTDAKNVVTLLAKEGYAIGAIKAREGAAIDGFSVTFMKVKDGKLDPKDNYESEWVGNNGQQPLARSGDGTPVIGIVGRTNDKDLTGLGLLYKGQEAFDPKRK